MCHDKQDKAHAIYSSRRWRELSKSVRRKNPVCCNVLGLHDGVTKPTTSTHHIWPLLKYPQYAYDKSKLLACCDLCHQALEEKERAGIEIKDLLVSVAAQASKQLFGDEVGLIESLVGCHKCESGYYCERLRSVRVLRCSGCDEG